MIQGQKYVKSTEFSTLVEEPINREQITYYPTWFNAQKQTTTGLFAEEKLVEKLIEKENKKFVRSTVEDIVISGVSGRFPSVEQEMTKTLLKDVQMMKEKKQFIEEQQCWSTKQQKNIEKRLINEQFFGMQQEEIIEPTIKTLMEVTYECLVDAGVNPVELKGTRTGVFIGMNKWESIEEQTRGNVYPSWMSTGKPMLAERLAHFFQLTGPKVTVESELSTSLVVLDKAINAIKLGLCDVAIVGGVKVGETVGVVLLQKRSTMPRRFYAKVLHSKIVEESLPITCEQYPTINGQIQTRILKELYAENGIDASSFLERERENVWAKHQQDIFIAPVVKRNVPLFVGVNQRNVEQEQGIFSLVKMLISIQRGIIPSNLKFQEPICESVFGEKLVNKNTKFFGGLMTLNSMVTLRSGRFLNTHILLQPNTDIVMSQCGQESFWNREDLTELSRQPRLFQFSARTQQELEEVLEHMQRKPTDLAMHFLLHPQTFTTPVSHPFRGFTILNSEEPIIKKIVELEQEKKRPIWFILSGLSGSIKGEWKQMAQELMKVDIFRQSIIRSTECLKPYGINLVELIYGQYPLNTWTTLVSITAVQVALIDCLKVAGIKYDGLIGHSLGELLCAYVEKALTAEETILTAYHFGKHIHEAKFPLYTMAVVKGITWEELKRRCPVGVVPVVFNGVENIIISGPKYELVQFIEQLKYAGIFAKELNEEETTFSHLPFHTELMQIVAKKLKVVLENEVIRTPRTLRSHKWISTSMPVQHWGSEFAKYFSVDYLVNSLVNPVLFTEACKFLPTDAICIEVSPKSILKSILKKTNKSEATWTKPFPEMSWIPLMKHKNYRMETPIVTGGYLEHFWYVFGKMHLKGINVDSTKLFVPVRHQHTVYPVPTQHSIPSWRCEEPRFIGEREVRQEFIRQEQEPRFVEQEMFARKFFSEQEPKFVQKDFARKFLEQEMSFPLFEKFEKREITHSTPVVFRYPIDLTSTLFETELVGHKVDGRVVYPTSGYLYMVWKSLAKMQGLKTVEQLPVVFEKVEIHRPTIMTIRGTPVKRNLTFEVRIVPTTGLFEIIEDGIIIVTGRVAIPNQKRFETLSLITPAGLEYLRREEIYSELKLKGYQYEGEFQPIVKIDMKAKYADMLWTGKWVPFLEGMIQMKSFGKRSTGGVMIPRRIQSLFIDPTVHLELVEKKMINTQYFNQMPRQQTFVVPVVYDRFTKKTVAGGIEIVGIKATFVPTFEKVERELLNTVERVERIERVERREQFPFGTIKNVVREEEQLIEEVEIIEQIKREYVDFYLRECKRYAEFIMKKIEFTTGQQMVRSFVPMPLPITLKHLIEKINCENKYFKHQQIVASLLEGGEFLRFLKNTVEQIEFTKEESVLRKMSLLFNDNMFFYKALEKDTILSLVNMKSYFFDFFKMILEQNKPEEFAQWNMESRIVRKPEEFGLWNLESRIRKPEESALWNLESRVLGDRRQQYDMPRIPFIPTPFKYSKYTL